MEKYGYGYKLEDRYIFRKKLGSGAGGSVYMAFDIKLNKCWAIKICSGYTGHEIEALKKIDYYAFPRIVDVISEGEVCFLVMDYIEGVTLEKYRKTHLLNERQIMHMGKKIAGAMNYLHKLNPALLYMDCKPENIIVTPSGDIRLVDLGSVYVCDDEMDNIVSGTVFYAPNEIKNIGLHKYSKPDVRSDIYSLGMTMYYMLMGCKTEYRDRRGNLCLRRKNRNISRMAERIVRKCTAIKMRDRYQNIGDVYDDMNNASSKGVKHAFSRVKGAMEPAIMKCLDVVCKCILCGGVLVNAYRYARYDKMEQLYFCVLAGVIFLMFCKRKTVYSWDNKKDIFRGAGARILMGVITVASAFYGVNSKAANYDCEVVEGQNYDVAKNEEYELTKRKGKLIKNDKEENDLYVVMYDEFGRNMLIRPGAVWETENDIHFTIPIEEISNSKCKITISCEREDVHKYYTFFCCAKQ